MHDLLTGVWAIIKLLLMAAVLFMGLLLILCLPKKIKGH